MFDGFLGSVIAELGMTDIELLYEDTMFGIVLEDLATKVTTQHIL